MKKSSVSSLPLLGIPLRPYLPTPTASLLDYNLVRDLGLKLQCQKFSFAGFKMRILGKVSVTVQCVHNAMESRLVRFT